MRNVNHIGLTKENPSKVFLFISLGLTAIGLLTKIF